LFILRHQIHRVKGITCCLGMWGCCFRHTLSLCCWKRLHPVG